MSSLIIDGFVAATGQIVQNGNTFNVNNQELITPASSQVALIVDVEPPHQSGVGWMYKNGNFLEIHIEPPEVDQEKAFLMRIERNQKLSSCDWTQLADAPSQLDQAAWATYRQKLRDITKQGGFPESISWPINPDGGK